MTLLKGGALADQVLYRKYRSRDFSQVVGQDHVVKTLSAAIASGRTSHAYLFTGPHGVGKTSVARILARSLNCTGDTKPCNQCPNCLAAINSSLDIVEIDAASNRSIDAVRDLREKVSLAPTQGKYKVYIIDEVHMLTTEAFNALLKTLEEPPSHAVFILATTEAHKLPETIISRTQRFAFLPITHSDIVKNLQIMADAEGIKIEVAAIELIASAARGGFRDAISMLDQVASSGQSPLQLNLVRDLLGFSGSDEIMVLSRALAAEDARGALESLAKLEAQGAQPGQVAIQLAEQWRAILRGTVGMSQPGDALAAELAHTVSPLRAAKIVETLIEVVRSGWPQLALEAAVVSLASTPTANDTPPTSRRIASQAPAPALTPAKTPVVIAENPPASSISTQSLGGLEPGLWPKVLITIKAQNNSLSALLQMYPVDFGDGEVTIKPRFNFHRDLFIKPINRAVIETAAQKVYGQPVKVSARTVEVARKGSRTQPDQSAELISSALEILGGEIVD